jgi:DNA-binding Lrp family transcriptional regulator
VLPPDRAILEHLQRGIPVCERPFLAIAAELGMQEEALIERVSSLLDEGVLTRFGPMFDAAAFGGEFVLAALQAPEACFDDVARQVNAHPEVAHNYRREHALNMWFVVGCERRGDAGAVLAQIERETGCEVIALPKEEEYFVGLHLEPR